jgi:hypothetical protein
MASAGKVSASGEKARPTDSAAHDERTGVKDDVALIFESSMPGRRGVDLGLRIDHFKHAFRSGQRRLD